ncbi:MAG: hypothetical protein V3W37_01790 [Candidatus Binatia bacterium]
MYFKIFIRGAVAFAFLVLAGGKLLAAEELNWPREYSDKDGAKVVMYQPQIESWSEYSHLKARVAVAFAPAGTKAPSLGWFWIQADTQTDLDSRQVNLSNFKVMKGRFPTLDAKASDKLLNELVKLLPKENVIVSLDRILTNLERRQSEAKPAAVRSNPPKILVSLKPAVLVLFDGKPVMSPIEGSDLTFAVNTNWDVFYHADSSMYYLLNGDAWLKAPKLSGPWTPGRKLPKSFKKLPKKDENWKHVRENVPGRKLKPNEVPKVFVSEVPAELILIHGEPTLVLIEGTQLLWVTNTESDLFLSRSDSHFYYLVSGRWFQASNLEEKWSFATENLPEDFAKIPPEHPRASVLASVPGTSQAEEAVMLAQIPQKATVERDKIKASVSYQGDPEFKPIEGTGMYYAANTSSDVIRVGDLYYLCFQAVWFVSTSPAGPWVVADKVPGEIYTIPPSSPVHHTTYVHVYHSTPTYVIFGYTSGYVGVYYSHGCMVYGTGWYYPSYVYWGPYYPVYYYRPVSYGVSAYYNPHTGTYGRGASVYGPYGGIGAASVYNPQTGTYARGAAAWGPYGARGWAEAYNPRTGTYARTRQGGTLYSSWGTTGVQRGNDWVRTARYSDSRGTVAGFQTSGGRTGFVAREGNNLYAGKDGQVYRKSGDSWQKYDDGNWSAAEAQRSRQDLETQARERANSPEARERRDSTQQRADSARQTHQDTLGQLDRDAVNRTRGSRRTEDFGTWSNNRTARPGRGSYGGQRGGRRRR